MLSLSFEVADIRAYLKLSLSAINPWMQSMERVALTTLLTNLERHIDQREARDFQPIVNQLELQY